MARSQRLFEQRIFVQGIHPPFLSGQRLRIGISASHSSEHIETLGEALR